VNAGVADIWIQLFDATAAPSNGTQPLDERLAPVGLHADFDYGLVGKPFANGLVAVCSTTSRSLTAGGTATFNWTRI
jgi:hypothetical protein